MGTNTLPAASSGNVIPATDHNALVTALLEDLVPRNASRVPTDVSGQLGTSLYRWLRAFIKEVLIGVAGNNLKIYEGASNQIWIERGGTSNETIKLKSGSIEFWFGGSKTFEFNSTEFLPPDDSIPLEKVDGFIFSSREVIDITDVETGSTVKNNLPGNALVFIEWYGDGNGSTCAVYSESNFSSEDHDITIAELNRSSAYSDTYSNFVKQGANIKYIGADLAGGRSSFRANIFYL